MIFTLIAHLTALMKEPKIQTKTVWRIALEDNHIYWLFSIEQLKGKVKNSEIFNQHNEIHFSFSAIMQGGTIVDHFAYSI